MKPDAALDPIVTVHKQGDTPAHLWPDPARVRCTCGAKVVEQRVHRSGIVDWVCENGHDDVATQMLKAAKAQSGWGPAQ